jgi:hypothetical protein
MGPYLPTCTVPENPKCTLMHGISIGHVHLGFSGTVHVGRYGPILKLHLWVYLRYLGVSESHSGSEWAAVDPSSGSRHSNKKEALGLDPRPFLMFHSTAAHSLPYHQSGVQADDQALKYVRHIKDHCMLFDFRGRGICTWYGVHERNHSA